MESKTKLLWQAVGSCIALALFATGAVGQSRVAARQTSAAVQKDINLPGNDYNNFDLPTPSPESCRQACDGDARCRAYTYVKPGYQGPNARCWLKSVVPAAVTDKCCVSGTKEAKHQAVLAPMSQAVIPAAPANAGGPIAINPKHQPSTMHVPGVDRPGKDYRDFDLPTDDPELCKQACDQDVNCSAFSYVKPRFQGPNPRCRLKWDVPPPVTNPCCSSGIKNTTNDGRQPGQEVGIDRHGNNYQNFDLSTADPGLCHSACNQDANCKSYTYVKPNVQGPNARCWLKSEIPAAVQNNCCISGVIARQTLPPPPPKQHVNYPVPDLSLMTLPEAVAALDAATLTRGTITGQQTSDALVVEQAPPPGRLVAARAPVSFTLARLELVLAADKSTPNANESVTFRLNFRSLPKKALAAAFATHSLAYRFYWDDDHAFGTAAVDTATHVFLQPGEYLVYGDAQVAGRTFASNKVKIVAGFQQIVLKPHSTRLNPGMPAEFRAEAIPSARPQSRVEYCFNWSDSTPQTCSSSSSALHTYARPGQFAPSVVVSINKSTERSSNPVPIEVKPVAQLQGTDHLVVGQNATFRLELIPPLTAADRARYCFRWQDKPDSECGNSSLSRRFETKGDYYISAEVEVNGTRATAAPLHVGVDPYRVTLSATENRIAMRKAGNFTATLTPATPARSRVEYCFRWNDGTPDICQAGVTAAHAFSSRGTYHPRVEVYIDGNKLASSDPLEVVVVLSWMDLVLRFALAMGALGLAYGARTAVKLMKVRVTANSGTSENRIANEPAVINAQLIRIRCVIPPATITLTSPGPVVTRRKGAHAA